MYEMKPDRNWFGRVVRLVAGITTAALLCAPAFASEKQLPEVSKDGLHLLKDSKVAIAYARPGATLDTYTKVKILDCYVEFRKNWQRDFNMNEIGLDGRVSDKDAEAIKEKLADEFGKVFTTQLTKAGYEVVEDAGPGVLLLRPALLNVDVEAPDVARAGIQRSWVRTAGNMTLYMELYDAETNTLLARVADPQADDPAIAQPANRATNRAAADRILRHWADLLAKNLGEVKEAAGSN